MIAEAGLGSARCDTSVEAELWPRVTPRARPNKHIFNSSAVGAHARKYKKPPSSRLQQNTKQKINKKLQCILIDKNIPHHAHHRNSDKLDDTDRAEDRK